MVNIYYDSGQGTTECALCE